MTRRIDPNKRKAPPRIRGKARIAAQAAKDAPAELPPYVYPDDPEGRPPTRDDDLACDILRLWRNLPTAPTRGEPEVIGYRYGKTRAEMLHTWNLLRESRKFAGTYFERNGRVDPDAGIDDYAREVEARVKQREEREEAERKLAREQARATYTPTPEVPWVLYQLGPHGKLPPAPHANQIIQVREQDGNVRTYANADDYDWSITPGEPGAVVAWRPAA